MRPRRPGTAESRGTERGTRAPSCSRCRDRRVRHYTAVKAAYLSTTLAIVVAERNLIYLIPSSSRAALVLERRRASVVAVALATAFVLYLVTTTPYTVEYPNSEAPGLAIAAFANRILRWGDDTIETTLVLIALAAARAAGRGSFAAACLARDRRRRRRTRAGLSLTTEI